MQAVPGLLAGRRATDSRPTGNRTLPRTRCRSAASSTASKCCTRDRSADFNSPCVGASVGASSETNSDVNATPHIDGFEPMDDSRRNDDPLAGFDKHGCRGERRRAPPFADAHNFVSLVICARGNASSHRSHQSFRPTSNRIAVPKRMYARCWLAFAFPEFQSFGPDALDRAHACVRRRSPARFPGGPSIVRSVRPIRARRHHGSGAVSDITFSKQRGASRSP